MSNYRGRLIGLLLAAALVAGIVVVGINAEHVSDNDDPRTVFTAFMNGGIEDYDKYIARGFKLYDCEYLFFDLDGDGKEELLFRDKESPGVWNFIFHYENGEIKCWLGDAMEESDVDYPLTNGTMVSEYSYGGMTTSEVYKFKQDGEREGIIKFFVQSENVYDDPLIKCPYYEIDDKEVDVKEYNEKFKAYVEDYIFQDSEWTDCNGDA